MNWDEISPTMLGVIVIVGVFSIIPSGFGGNGAICFDENLVEVACDDPACTFSEPEDSCIFLDDDEDGIHDQLDNCPLEANTDQSDVDGDGVGDICDNAPNDPNPDQSDVDNDGVGDVIDNCPIPNPDQADIDGNGIGDACQDVDGDGVLDLDDNCPFISNFNELDQQLDSDGNGIGDACEEDVELLVDASFPPGDSIEVDLPEDFSIELELPDTEGGDVLIEKTDAGDTPGNFSFLGFIIDFNAPCTDVCEISFSFTQASLDEQGLTIEDIRIFHDMDENLSFDANEAIIPTITGDDPFTATISATFTSKFSVGGIKALALGALSGSGGGSRGGSPPTLENLSFDGVRTVNEDGTMGFGGLILDEILSVNNFPTQSFETGVPSKLIFPFYEDNGVSALDHVAVYVLHEGDETVNDSELYLIYNRNKPLQTLDTNGYLSDFSLEIKEKSSRDVDFIFGMTFALPMEPSDVIVRVWDNYRRSTDYKFIELFEVVQSDSSTSNDNSELTSWESATNDNSVVDSSTILKYDFQSFNEDNDLGELFDYNSNEIPLWIKFNAHWWSQDEIGNDDFIAGMQYLKDNGILRIPETSQGHHEGVKEIPDWLKQNAEWWAGDLVSDEEFVGTIQWLIQEGVMEV